MKIEIDQSGKIEYTAVDTVIADSLGNSILLKAREKRTLQKNYRQIGKPRRFVFEIFALLIALIIEKSYNETSTYVIDAEYPGRFAEIKNNIIKFSRDLRLNLREDQLATYRVGKKSKAHETAYESFKKRLKTELVTAKQLGRFITPIKKDRVLVSV